MTPLILTFLPVTLGTFGALAMWLLEGGRG